VPVELNVRGICCLKPGVPGVSEHITVVSVVGRFLEHSRVYAFERGEETEVYVGSADLMPRNLDTRVELLAPVLDPDLRAEVVETIELCLADNVNAWVLDAEGAWQRRRPDGAPLSVQRQLMARHAARAAETATT
jgi:polyphosphate kinase